MTEQRYIIILNNNVNRSDFINDLKKENITINYIFFAKPNCLVATLNGDQYSIIKSDPRVLVLEQDTEIHPNSIQIIPSLGQSGNWGLDRIDQRTLPLKGTFAYSRTGKNVDLYVIDTGILYTHDEFQGRAQMLPGFDPFSDGGVDDWGTNGHGTAVASCAAGMTCGVAKNVSIYSVKVFKRSGGYASIFIDACAAVKNHHITKSNQRPSVVNMSLSYSTRQSSINSAVRELIEAGCIVVNSAGNDNKDASTYSPQSTELDFKAVVQLNHADIGNSIEFYVGENPYSSSAIKLNTIPVNYTGNIETLAQNICYNINQLSSFSHISNDGLTQQSFKAYDSESTIGKQNNIPSGSILITSTLTKQWADRDMAISWKYNNSTDTIAAKSAATIAMDHRNIKLIVVGAVDDTDSRAWFSNNSVVTTNGIDGASESNYGSVVDIFAPGTSIYSATRNGNSKFAFNSGTSFSAPLAAGVLCLHLEGTAKNEITPKEAHDWLLDVSTKGVLTNIPETSTTTVSTFSPLRSGNYRTYVNGAGNVVKWSTVVNTATIITWSVLRNSIGSWLPLTTTVLQDVPEEERYSAIIGIIQKALDQWSAYANIQFKQVEDDNVVNTTTNMRFFADDIQTYGCGVPPTFSINGFNQGSVVLSTKYEDYWKNSHGYSLGNGELYKTNIVNLDDSFILYCALLRYIGNAIGINTVYDSIPPNGYDFSGPNVMDPVFTNTIGAVLVSGSLRDGDIAGVQTLYGCKPITVLPKIIDGTPNRLLFSHYTNQSISWITDSELGIYDEHALFETRIIAQSTTEDGDLLTVWYSSDDIPSYITLDKMTGIISGTVPEVYEDTEVDFTITATDGQNTISRIFTFKIKNNNLPPRWITPYTPDVQFIYNEDTNIEEYYVSVAEPDGDDVIISKHPNDWPSWLQFEFIGEDLSYSNKNNTRERLFVGKLYGSTPEITTSISHITHKAVLRASDGTEYCDRTFIYSIEKEPNALPVWSTDSGRIATVLEGEEVSIQLNATDPNDDVVYYILENADQSPLPDGLSLDTATGVISGIVEPIQKETDVSFTISAYDGYDYVPRNFSILIKNVQNDYIPRWITPSGNIGTVISDSYGFFVVEASDPGARNIIFSEIYAGSSKLPNGMTLSSNGIISGTCTVSQTTTYTFTIRARPAGSIYPIDRTFNIIVSSASAQDKIEWVSTETLGEIGEEEVSKLEIYADITRNYSGNTEIKYLIGDETNAPRVGNSPLNFLPSGLTLTTESNKALIIGRPTLVNQDTVCNFTLQAYVGDVSNPTGTSSIKKFSFMIKNNYTDSNGFINVDYPISGKTRMDWIRWNTSSLFDDNLLFRKADSNFGRVFEPSLYIIGGLKLNNVANPYSDFASKLGDHHRSIKLTIGDMCSFTVYNKTKTEKYYDILYHPIIDEHAAENYIVEYSHPTQENQITTILPASINNIRTELINNIGFSIPNTERLPEWMSNQRIINSISYSGYQPALVVAYVVAGQGNRIINLLKNNGTYNEFSGRQIILDKYLVSVVRPGGRSQKNNKYISFPM